MIVVVQEIVAQHPLGSHFEQLPERRIGIGSMQVRVEQVGYLGGLSDIAAHRSEVDLGQSVVQRLAIAQGFVDRCVEAV
jgi:hypothetical protein